MQSFATIRSLPREVYGDIWKRQGILLVVPLQLVVLLTICTYITIIPDALLGSQAWRASVVLLIGGSGAIWLFFHIRFHRPTLKRVVTYAMLIGGPYMLFLAVETVNAMYSGDAVLVSRVAWLRLFTLALGSVTLFLALGGGKQVDRGMRVLLVMYAAVAVYIAVAGILAWSVLTFGFADAAAWPPPSELSAKLNNKGGASVFSMPYMLGLALVGSTDSDPLGTFRMSGLSVEPNSAAFFITPAIFALAYLMTSRRRLAIAGCGVMLVFLFLAFSVTNVLSLAAVAGLALLRYTLLPSNRFRLHHLAAVIVALLALFMVLRETSFYQGRLEFVRVKSSDSISSDATTSTHRQMWEADALLGKGIFDDPGEGRGSDHGLSILSSLAFWFQSGSLALAGLVLFLSNRSTYLLGLMPVYVVLHSMKDPGHVLGWPMYMFVIIVTILAMVAPVIRRRRDGELSNDASTATAAGRLV